MRNIGVFLVDAAKQTISNGVNHYVGVQLQFKSYLHLPIHLDTMPISPKISAVRNLTLQKIGRNVVNFQKMEAMLKFILTITNFSVPISMMQTHIETQTKQIHNQPMGRLVESTAKALHSEAPSAPLDINEIWITFSLNLNEGGSQIADWRREMQVVVSERNTLIHQMLSTWDANSIDSCNELCKKLDSQRERILNAYEHLESIVKAIRESHKELALEADEMVKHEDDKVH